MVPAVEAIVKSVARMVSDIGFPNWPCVGLVVVEDIVKKRPVCRCDKLWPWGAHGSPRAIV